MQTDLGLCVSLQSWLSNAHSGQQLSDVAKGLEYLHYRNIVHGDLKPVRSCPGFYFTVLTPYKDNVHVDVVDNTPRACIANFGIVIFTGSNNFKSPPPTGRRSRSLRWSAPELLKEEYPTINSDVFSFAMIIIEVRR